MIKVLVTGANGQLGHCIKDAASYFLNCEFYFASRKNLDIGNRSSVEEFFKRNSFDYCINTAAYTNVEKAESEADVAYSINAEGVKFLAECCKNSDTVLIHISTDYVFDGRSTRPYVETDKTNPINVYGATKLRGEQYVEEICTKYFIFRTSWLYSQYGHNFLTSILKNAKEQKSLTITTEQIGTPTNANDLAKVLLQVVISGSTAYGLYHFSNEGEATWFDFAEKILFFSNQLETTNLAKTDHYATIASRPKYSILSKAKICNSLSVGLIDWKESLRNIITAEVGYL
jgi:dTDP-4-dehydrorhamnose reductase